ncbi:MAG: TadE/TadG family type IV pilus assembly protein [Xanthobacteraceae bacterium]|jgi:Flp pilus assembly protein TadG
MFKFAGRTLATEFARARVLVANFRTDRRANVAVMTAIAVIPIFAAIGCVVDYTMATTVKTRLQAAADATSLAVISVNSSVVATAKKMTGSGEVSGDSAFINNFFTSDLSTLANYPTLSLTTASVVKNGQVLTATVAYTAEVPTYFMGIFGVGFKNITVSGTSKSTYTLPTYLDVYLMLDVSGSMGFPSTSGEQTRLMAINPDSYGQYAGGCAFACHFTGAGTCKDVVVSGTSETTGTCGCPDYGTRTDNGKWIQAQVTQIAPTGQTTNNLCKSYDLTRTAGNSANTPVTFCPSAGTSACIQLRLDAVGYAVTNLLQTAWNMEQVPNQFRVGLFPFIVNLPTANPSTSCPNFPPCPLTTTLNGSANSAGTINWAAQQIPTVLDTGNPSGSLGSGGTNFGNAFTSLTTLIKNTGIGTGAGPTNTLPYVFLITDGVNNSQLYQPGFTGSNPALFSTTYCTTLKNLGVTIAVLYIPYQPLPATKQYTASWATSEDTAVNGIIPSDPGNLQSCASPNFFYTANTPADINNALNTMFQQAASTAHVTQ